MINFSIESHPTLGVPLRTIRMPEPNPLNSVLWQAQSVDGEWITLVAIRGDGVLYVTNETHSEDHVAALQELGFVVGSDGGVVIGEQKTFGFNGEEIKPLPKRPEPDEAFDFDCGNPDCRLCGKRSR